jgi:hypothetical protein
MLERRQREFELIKQRYGEVEVAPDLTWIVIRRFPLPEGWSKTQTDLLVLLPAGYPTTPPDNFYTDHDLKLATGAAIGNSSENVSVNGRVTRQFSFHIEADWRPHADLLQGHNLLTFLLGVENRMKELN